MRRRSFVLGSAASLSTPFVVVPSYIKAQGRRSGIAEQVEVITNVLGMATTGLPLSAGSALASATRFVAAAFDKATNALRQSDFVLDTETEALVHQADSNGNCSGFAYRTQYEDACMPFFNLAYSPNAPVTMIEGPSMVAFSYLIEQARASLGGNLQEIHDWCWPRVSIQRQMILFDSCDGRTDRITSKLGLILLTYECGQANTFHAEIKSRETTETVLELRGTIRT